MSRSPLLPRPLHPFAWWVWAICCSVAATGTSNPLLLLAIIAVACLVTFSRRGDNPWARGFVVYLALGAFVVVMRIAFRLVFGGGDGPTVLFRLPEIGLPWWVGGIRLLGPVSLESLLAGGYDGLRLAAIIICLGAANSLANPKRLLAALPGALYEAGTILVVAVSVFPQLGESFLRVRRARKLRRPPATGGRRERYRAVEGIIVPVLSDALDRSISLAASMDVRGYGRHGSATASERRLTTAIGFAGIVAISVGAYLHLSRIPGGPVIAGRVSLVPLACMAFGVLAVVVAMRRAGRTVTRSAYRPIAWRLGEWVAVGCGVLLVLSLEWTRATPDVVVLNPLISPFEWPTLTPVLVIGLAAAALPAFATPAPSLAGATSLATQEGLS